MYVLARLFIGVSLIRIVTFSEKQVLKKAALLAELSSQSVSLVHHSFIATGDDKDSHPGNVAVGLVCLSIVCRYCRLARSPVLYRR
jgi:hypothetical protein